MDPVATLAKFDEALANRDSEGITESAEYLIDWLEKGGFAPFESGVYETDWRAGLHRPALLAYLGDVRRAAQAVTSEK